MDGITHFILAANISRIIYELENSDDAVERGLLRLMIFIEEERFSRYSERMQITQSNIAENASRIVDQKRRIDALRAKGRDTTESEQLLHNMLSVRDLLFDARKRWAN
jgi:hypothetical protein